MEESGISLKFILRAFKRHIIVFLCIVVCFILLGSVYVKKFNTPNYQAESIVSVTGGNTTINPAISEVITSKQLVAEVVYDKLVEEKITHTNKSKITVDEIASGIATLDTTTPLQLKVTFTNSDEKIVQDVLDTILEISITVVDEKYPNNKIAVISAASEPVNVARSNKLYLAIAAFLGIVVGVVFILVYEAKRNILYEKKDIASLANNIFDIKYGRSATNDGTSK